jgi:hypothetical protein
MKMWVPSSIIIIGQPQINEEKLEIISAKLFIQQKKDICEEFFYIFAKIEK